MKSLKQITKRGLSLFVALLMCMSVMSLTAFAEGEVNITNVTLQGGSNANDGGNFVITAPGEMEVSTCTLRLRTDQAFSFVKTDNPATGELYAKEVGTNSATLNFNVAYMDADMNASDYAMNLTSTNGTLWTGTFGTFNGMTLNMLAAALRTQGASLQVAAGVMGGTSQGHGNRAPAPKKGSAI